MSAKVYGVPFNIGELDRNDQRTIIGAGGELIATVAHECLAVREPEMEANAAFIVKAVNNHDALLAALKAASDELVLHPGSPLRVQIDAALQSASGSPEDAK